MSADALAAILGMALVTIAVKAGGLLLASRLPATGFVAAWLRHIPGAVLAALIAPSILGGGPAEAIAALAAAIGFLLTCSLLPAMLAGVAVVFVARLVPGL